MLIGVSKAILRKLAWGRLEKASTSNNLETRQSAACAFLVMEDKTMVPLINRAIMPKEISFLRRTDLIKLLGRFGDNDSVEILRCLAKESDPRVSLAAIESLISLGKKDLVPYDYLINMAMGRDHVAGALRLLSLLNDSSLGLTYVFKAAIKDPRRDIFPMAVQIWAAQALADYGNRDIIPIIKDIILSPQDSWVLSRAVDILAQLNEPIDIPSLQALLTHSDENIRMTAAIILIKLGDLSGLTELESYVKQHSSLSVVETVSENLFKIEASKVNPVICRWFDSRSFTLKLIAANIMLRNGNKLGRGYLLRTASLRVDDNYFVRLWCIGQLLEKGIRDDSFIFTVLEAIKSKGVSPFALELAGDIKDERAIPLLGQVLETQTWPGRLVNWPWYHAANALAKIGSDQALEILEKGRKNIIEEVQIASVAGIIKMLSQEVNS